MLNILFAIIVSASLDSTTLFIGDQVNLHLQAVTAANETVQMPVYGEMLIPEVEIVKRTAIDTTRLGDGRLQLNQSLTLTAFKDSLFYIGGIPFVAGGDTFFSDPLSLNVVQPFQVDTAMAITPIKGIYKTSIWWGGVLRLALLVLLLVLLGFGCRYAWKRWGYLLKGSEPEEKKTVVPLRPAEEVALEKLDVIRSEKKWQEGRTKEYHTELTDVVREYISRRFDVQSTEKTSDETLQAMRTILTSSDRKDLYTSLNRMLRLADLVKFAKWTTTPEENEQSLREAYLFVNETTPVAPAETTAEDATTTETKPTVSAKIG